ncbi:MAG: hypothetical protein ACK41T_00625 [Pseudobdellovibrio sp.]
MKKKLSLDYIEKIKDLKVLSDRYTPTIIKPALNYALGWLVPELLGTGFELKEVTDERIKALIPYKKINCDFHGQIHSGLVVNAAFEVLGTFVSRHWAVKAWEIVSYETEVSKKSQWDKDLLLELSVLPEDADKFVVDLQKNERSILEVTITIKTKGSHRSDFVKIKADVVKRKLLNSI